jgi:hypothetical protein
MNHLFDDTLLIRLDLEVIVLDHSEEAETLLSNPITTRNTGTGDIVASAAAAERKSSRRPARAKLCNRKLRKAMMKMREVEGPDCPVQVHCAFQSFTINKLLLAGKWRSRVMVTHVKPGTERWSPGTENPHLNKFC